MTYKLRQLICSISKILLIPREINVVPLIAIVNNILFHTKINI